MSFWVSVLLKCSKVKISSILSIFIKSFKLLKTSFISLGIFFFAISKVLRFFIKIGKFSFISLYAMEVEIASSEYIFFLLS